MAWPTTPSYTNANVDSPADNPSLARADISAAMTDLSNVIAGRNQANGVAPLDASSKIPVANIPLVPVANGIISFQTTGAYIWIVPAGIYKIVVEAWGAGGGGAYGTTARHGGGGGAGGGAIKVFSVSPGDTVSMFVGIGGAGGISPGGNGGVGGDTTVTVNGVTITGLGGEGGYADPPLGGVGGGANNGDVNLEGGTSMTGIGNGTVDMGGLGGSNMRSGAAPGHGAGWGFGGGGYGSGTNGPNPAISGKDGGVLITW